jgi:hypothetical protein
MKFEQLSCSAQPAPSRQIKELEEELFVDAARKVAKPLAKEK